MLSFKRTALLAVAAPVALLLLAGCLRHLPVTPLVVPLDQPYRVPLDMPVPEVQTPDSAGGIDAQVLDTIEIKAYNVPSDGGYWWYITSGFDSSIATLVSESTAFPPRNGNYVLCGAPATITWHFTANRPGTTSLTIKLFRSWEPDSVLETRTYTLTVR